MTSTIRYAGDLRTECVHLQSGTMIETDAPKDNHGKGERFSPTDLVATALGACMLSILGIVGRTHSINIDGACVDIEKIMVADPMRRIGEINVWMKFPADKNYSEKEMKILEHAAMTCPVLLSLHPDTKKTVTFQWDF